MAYKPQVLETAAGGTSLSSAGTLNNVLTSNGTIWTSAPPKYALIQSQVASSSAALNFTTGLTAYSQIMIVLNQVLPATNTAILQMQLSNNGGSSYQATGYLAGCNHSAYNSATLTNTNSTTAWVLTGPQSNSTSNTAFCGSLIVDKINMAASPMMMGSGSYLDTTAAAVSIGFFGGQAGTTGLNALRFLYSTGNIASGRISVYGLATS